MNKLTKKFLLSFSLGLAAVGSVVPVAMTTTSCQSEDSSFSWKSLVGKRVGISTKNPYYDETIVGVVLKVDGEYIYVDNEYYYPIIQSEYEGIIKVPINDVGEIGFAIKEQYLSNEAFSYIINSIKEEFTKYVSYSVTTWYIESFINRIADPQGKKLGEEMLSIFKSYMTYLTVEKIDEALVDLQQNNSLRKWQKLIDYYINKFTWNRDKFFDKYYEIQAKYNVAMSSEELSSISNICKRFYSIGSSGYMKLMK